MHINKKIIIVEDERDISNAIKTMLVAEGFQVTQVFDGFNAVPTISRVHPDLVLLDIMLPNVTGTEIIKDLKKIDTLKEIPIIFTTAKTCEIDQVVGYELGAIDYVTKPFSMHVLIRKIKALLGALEHKEVIKDETISIGDLFINPKEFKVTIADEEIVMTFKEFKLLQLLASNINKVFTREELLSKVWKIDSALETRTVDTHIKKIRQKLKDYSHYIKTIHGLGYKLSNE